MSQPKPGTTVPATSTAELTKAVSAVNADSTGLEQAATQIVEQIALPVFRQALSQQPELRQLKPAVVVDLISSALATDLFADARPDEDVIVQLQNGYVTIPAAQREILQSGITRVLTKRSAELEQLLAKGKS